jgi:pimeloyl-ACP methyl ester carboxylesterase
MFKQNKFPSPDQVRFVEITPETERLQELDHFWIEINREFDVWILWRFSYIDTDLTEVFLPDITKARFNEPILLIHGMESSHIIFNWFARELWRFGFRNIFALDYSAVLDLNKASDSLSSTIRIIKEITKAHKVSVIAHDSGGVVTRFYAKFRNGAENIRVLAMIGCPHESTQYLENLQNQGQNVNELRGKSQEILEEINSLITEKELYYLTQLNIGGTIWSTPKVGMDKTKFSSLPDAINLAIGQTHLKVHKHQIVLKLLQPFLVPQVAVFKIRLLTLVNIQSPLYFMIHYHQNLTQLFPRKGILAPTEKVVIPENPLIIYTNYVNLNQDIKTKIVIYAFNRDNFSHQKLGIIEIPVNIEKLPNVEYYSLKGELKQRIDFAIYSYIP